MRLRRIKKSFDSAYEVLSSIAPLIRVLKELDELSVEKPKLFDGLTHYDDIKNLLKSARDGKLAELISLLNSKDFAGEEFEYENVISVLKAYKILYRVKEEFIGALRAIGEIDCYRSLAALTQEHFDKKNGFGFPVNDVCKRPYLKFEGLWDLFIVPGEVVENDVELGGRVISRNALISGPNAGGKSTFMRSALFAVIMAQTCAIAPARSMNFTPFKYVDSYVNVEDDPVAKKSLFKAEVARVTSILKNIRSVPKGSYSFIIADEMFRGTNPADASCFVRAVCKNVASKSKNSIWIVSSHLPEAPNIPKDTGGIFANYHVGINKDASGKFSGFTYKLHLGSTRDKTAFDILEQTGMDGEIVDCARRISDGTESQRTFISAGSSISSFVQNILGK
ncbi:hypothetical protein ACFLY6_01005 [Candidatus Dependentiae bacterium]